MCTRIQNDGAPLSIDMSYAPYNQGNNTTTTTNTIGSSSSNYPTRTILIIKSPTCSAAAIMIEQNVFFLNFTYYVTDLLHSILVIYVSKALNLHQILNY